VRKVISDLVAVAVTKNPADLWKMNVKLILVTFMYVHVAQSHVEINTTFYRSHEIAVASTFRAVSKMMLEVGAHFTVSLPRMCKSN